MQNQQRAASKLWKCVSGIRLVGGNPCPKGTSQEKVRITNLCFLFELPALLVPSPPRPAGNTQHLSFPRAVRCSWVFITQEHPRSFCGPKKRELLLGYSPKRQLAQSLS